MGLIPSPIFTPYVVTRAEVTMIRESILDVRRGLSPSGLALRKRPTRLPQRLLTTAATLLCALQVASASDLGENAAGYSATPSCTEGRAVGASGGSCGGRTLGASFVQGLAHLERLVWFGIDEKIVEESSHVPQMNDDHHGSHNGPGAPYSMSMEGLSLIDGRAVPGVFKGVVGDSEEDNDNDTKSGHNRDKDHGKDIIANKDSDGSGSGVRVPNADNMSLATAASDVGVGETTDKQDTADRRGGVSTHGSGTASRKVNSTGRAFAAGAESMAKMSGPSADASRVSDAIRVATRLAKASSAAVPRWLLQVQTHVKAAGAVTYNKYQSAGVEMIIPIFMTLVILTIVLVALASALTFSSEAPALRHAVDAGYMAPFSPQTKQRSPIPQRSSIPPLNLPPQRATSMAQPPSQLESKISLLPRSSSELMGSPKGDRVPQSDGVEAAPEAAPGGETSVTLSPDLVVPDNCECALLMPIKEIRPGSYHITDMVGSEVLHVSPKGPKRRLALMSAAGDVLAQCCAARPSAPPGQPGSAEFHFFRPNGDYFALLSRGTDQERYTLSTVRGTQMSLWGYFGQHSVNVTGDAGKLLATTEKCQADFDPDGEYFRLRVASKMDVGLVLCSLLCIFHLGEGQL